MRNTIFFSSIVLLSCLILPPALAAPYYCPEIKGIKKNPNSSTWTADQGNFKSYDMSFATSLAQFMGAQWVGANVGQLTCVYSTQPKTAFPVMLIFHTLTYQPSGGQWTKNLGGYSNCGSHQQQACPFKVLQKKKTGNIYQEAEQLKIDSSTPPTE